MDWIFQILKIEIMTVDDYAKILFKLLNSIDESEYDIAIRVFFELLISKKVMSKSDLILDKYNKLLDEAKGSKHISITLAHEGREVVSKLVTEVFGNKADYTISIDEEIIGGIILQDGNTIYDASIKTQLSKLKDFLD